MNFELPENWRLEILASRATLVMGNSPPGDTYNGLREGVPLLNGPSEFGARHPEATTWTTAPRRFSEPGDVLFCVRGSTTGRMNRADQPYCIGRGVAAIRGSSPADTDFIEAALTQGLPRLLALATGSTFPSLSAESIGSFRLPWPPEPERRRIGQCMRTLDDKVLSNDRTRRRAEAVAAAFFTWAIRHERLETTSVEELIEHGALVIGDGFRAKNSELGPEGLPFARAGSLQDGFDFTSADRLPESRALEVRSKCSAPGDVVFTSKGTVGRFALVDVLTEPFVYSPQLCFWRSLDRERIPPAVLFSWMQSPQALRQIDALKGQTDMADYVSLRDQRSMVISLPGPDGVARLAHALDPLAAMGGRLRSESLTLRLLRMTLLPKLITGEIRVSDIPEPAETIGALGGALA